jgi:dihydroflavonol-4-reductase
MPGITALVTGSTGFIGAHLCRALVERGYRVRAFHRPTSSPRLLERLEVEHALGDLTQPETLQAAMKGMEVVFHSAAWMGGSHPTGQQYAATVEGTRNVLQAAQAAGVHRLVHTSSVAALGVPGEARPGRDGSLEPVPIDERHTWNYRPDFYPYGYAKYLAELEVQKAVARRLDAVIVNPTLVFGAGDIYRQAGSIVTQVAERRVTVAIEGGINCAHVADVVDGHLAALACGRTGERYILGGENLTHLGLVQLIADVTGAPEPGVVLPTGLVRWLARPAHVLRAFLSLPVSPELLRLAGYYFFYDLGKSERDLGLTERRPVREAIAQAYEWFRSAAGSTANLAHHPV